MTERPQINAKLLTTTALLAGGVLFGLSTQAGAAVCGTTGTTLDTYLGAGFTCTLGDKTFSGFSYTPDGNGLGGESTPAATAVTVVPNLNAPTAFGFTFDGIWTSGTPGAGGIADSALNYTVSVNPGSNFVITDANSTMAATATGDSGSFGSTTESIGGHSLIVNTSNPPGSLTNSITFPGVTSLTVSKDIEANGGTIGGTGSAEVSSISDTVSQTSTAVPEPASLALIGSALAGLGLVGWRRRKHL